MGKRCGGRGGGEEGVGEGLFLQPSSIPILGHPNHVFTFSSLCGPEGTTSNPLPHAIHILHDIYQFLLRGQKHTSGTEGTRILRIPGPKKIRENSELKE